MSTESGVFAAMITPFSADGALDVEALHAHIDFLIESGIHGLIPAGSTGEAQSLTPDEYRTLIRETVAHTAGRVPVFAGCSANSTRQVVANCRLAEEVGATGVMICSPEHSLPDEAELYEHFAAIAAAISLPIMIYNNPPSTGVDIQPELLGRLSQLEHIDYVKDSSMDCTRIMRILEESNDRLVVFSGVDSQALENFAVGARGWVTGSANVIPRQCVALYVLAVEKRQIDDALALYRQLYPYLTVVEAKYVQVAKAGLEFLGHRAGLPRPPLLPMSDEFSRRAQRALEQAQRALELTSTTAVSATKL